MKIEMSMSDAVKVATALARYAHNAAKAANEFPESDVLVRASDEKFELLNRYREAVGLDSLTFDELKGKFAW